MAGADRTRQVPAVIVGAGPAGLAAAVTLARNGIGSLLVERNLGLSPLPRATAVSTRTMELLRSWGLEDEIRAGQLEIAAVGAWAAESLASPDGVVVPLGHPDFEQSAAASPTTLAAVPQDHLEPVLLRHLRGFGLAEVRFGTELVALAEDAEGVAVSLREVATGRRWTVRSGYVVGADGAHSRVRGLLGIAMDGPDHLDEQLTVLFEAPLGKVVGDRRHGIYFVQHPEAGGRVRAQRPGQPVAVRPRLGPGPRTAGGLHRRAAGRPHPDRRRGRQPAGPAGGQGRVLVRGPGRRALPAGVRLPGRRRRPAHDPAGRHGDEHRRGRGPRPRLEARLGAARLGRRGPARHL
jgi:2-polyprenyl-6-methoxyphenol hydroxylase-like FAD-dependent oxidoreductase